ncbi:MAG: hypothetical protein WA712_14860, partial [Pseudolabrys sp.]
RCSLGSQSKLQRIFFRGMCGVVRWALVALSILRGLVVLTQETLTAFGVPVLIAAIPTFVVLIAVIVLSVRLIILFPALAVNARGTNAPCTG